MAEKPYNVHIRTTADASGAEITQQALEETAQAGEKIVDAVTKGDRATAAFVAKLKQLSPEALKRVESEMRAIAVAEEKAGRDASALFQQLERVQNIKLDKTAASVGGIFGGVTAGTVAANAITQVTNAIGEHLRASVELADQLDDLAGRAGVAASELQKIGNVAQQNNGSIAGTADALSKVQISAEGAIAGSKPLLEMFQRLGISSKDLQSLSPDQLFYKISDAVATTSDRGRTYADVVGVMGRSSKDLFTTLELGSAQIQKLGSAIGTFSDKTIKDLAKAKDSLTTFQNQLTIWAGNAVSFFRPTEEGLNNWALGLQELTDALYGTSTNVTDFEAVQQRAAEGAAKTKKPIDEEAAALDALADASKKATDEIGKISAKFRDAELIKLPLKDQLVALEAEIHKVQGAIGLVLPGGSLMQLPEIFDEAAKRGGDAGLRIAQLAEKYVALKDRIAAVGAASTKASDAAVKGAVAEIEALQKENVGVLATKLKILERLAALGDMDAKRELNKSKSQSSTQEDFYRQYADDSSVSETARQNARASLDKIEADKLRAELAEADKKLAEIAAKATEAVKTIGTASSEGLTKVGDAATEVATKLPPLFDPVAAAIRENLPAAIESGLSNVSSAVTGAVGDLSRNFAAQAAQLARAIQAMQVDIGALQRRPAGNG